MVIVFHPPAEQDQERVLLIVPCVTFSPDQYERAVEDMLACLQLREFVLEPTDRRLAEMYE